MRCRDGTDENQTCAKNEQVENRQRPILSEKDFYPTSDDRCWKSNLDDIKGGDNFADYAEYYFRTYIEED